MAARTVSGELAERILGRINETAGLYYRLILAVGPPGSGKTRALQEVAREGGFPIVNVNLELSRRLLDLTGQQRVFQMSALLAEIVAAYAREVVLLDNIEILFDVALQQDPLRLLQQLARSRPVIAAWNGYVRDGYLAYATPAHREFRRYSSADLLIVATEPSG